MKNNICTTHRNGCEVNYPVCPYCGGTGKVTAEYRSGDQMEQSEVKCECQVDPEIMEIEKQIDDEKKEEAGLVWGGMKDGEEHWIGTDKQWKKYEQLNNE